jgi:cobalt-zinc-cadmium efflux system outer membrane protein
MHASSGAAATAAVSLFLFSSFSARAADLTLERALALARERAPQLAMAATRVDAARGRLAGASALVRDNPVLDIGAGRRLAGSEGDSFALEAAVLQPFEIHGGRAARIEEARAALEQESAARDDEMRRVLRDAASAFLGALHAEQRLRVARGSEELAAELARVAERRYRADDVPVLDWNVSRAALARAQAERLDAEAAREGTLAALKIALGWLAEEPLAVAGELAARCDVANDATPVAQRPDLQALEAELRAAEAEARAARAEVWPHVAAGASYERDDEDDVALGLFQVSPPLFQRAQAERAEAESRARRLRFELDAARRAAEIQLRSAREICALRAAAAEELERNALPLLDDNEQLARRSYETGEIGLGELLEVRRQLLDIRREHLARRLDAALAGVELAAQAGVLR